MTAAEFMEWLAMEGFDPLPDARADLQLAMLNAAVLNAAGGKGKGRAFQPKDFMPFRDPPAPASVTAGLRATLKALSDQ